MPQFYAAKMRSTALGQLPASVALTLANAAGFIAVSITVTTWIAGFTNQLWRVRPDGTSYVQQTFSSDPTVSYPSGIAIGTPTTLFIKTIDSRGELVCQSTRQSL